MDRRIACAFIFCRPWRSAYLLSCLEVAFVLELLLLIPRPVCVMNTFDDSFVFLGKRTTGGSRRRVEVPQYTLVGNAIPPHNLTLYLDGQILKNHHYLKLPIDEELTESIKALIAQNKKIRAHCETHNSS